MSSTNRTKQDGTRTQRSPADYYATPPSAIHPLLDAMELPEGNWLEPACGNGALITAINGWYESRKRVAPHWTAIDIRAEAVSACRKSCGLHADRAVVGSFLDYGVHVPYAVIITNPPFSTALEFMQHALQFNGSVVVMLQRLNFLASMKRRDFWRNNMPDVYVLPKRPSFVGGATDSTDYCWYVWRAGMPRSRGFVEVL